MSPAFSDSRFVSAAKNAGAFASPEAFGVAAAAGAADAAGAAAPSWRPMGYAGAIVSGGKGTAAGTIEALQAAGIAVAETPATMADTLIARMKERP